MEVVKDNKPDWNKDHNAYEIWKYFKNYYKDMKNDKRGKSGNN
jgi:hypothetical protein